MWQNIRSAAEAMLSNDLGLASAIIEVENLLFIELIFTNLKLF